MESLFFDSASTVLMHYSSLNHARFPWYLIVSIRVGNVLQY